MDGAGEHGVVLVSLGTIAELGKLLTSHTSRSSPGIASRSPSMSCQAIQGEN